MAKVEVLYPFGGAHRGDVVDVADDKVGALRRLKWAREIEAPPVSLPAAKAKAKRARLKKEPDIDADETTETE
ncbi:MAG TPA: hypothetical protein VM487_25810 [Phycisphaerae bacterium]|nr:hypothetical protein [Phycisphaerae bacterium]